MNFFDLDVFLIIRLLAAAVLGGLIGLERGRKNHEAGLRTHIVLCLGAASVMIISECINEQFGSGDIMRLGAQVISGVGFLGAGSIIIDGNRVRGITTAAGLWTTACVGLAVGAGYYIVSGATVLIMLFAMWGLRSLSSRLESKMGGLVVRMDSDNNDALKNVLAVFEEDDFEVNSVKLEGSVFIVEIKSYKGSGIAKTISKLTEIGGVTEVTAV